MQPNGETDERWGNYIAEFSGGIDDPDKVFAAEARTDLPAALDEIERLQKENDTLQSQIRFLRPSEEDIDWAVKRGISKMAEEWHESRET
jgi:hypothetical protein